MQTNSCVRIIITKVTLEIRGAGVNIKTQLSFIMALIEQELCNKDKRLCKLIDLISGGNRLLKIAHSVPQDESLEMLIEQCKNGSNGFKEKCFCPLLQ